MKRLPGIKALFLYSLLVITPAFTTELELTKQPESIDGVQAESVLASSTQNTYADSNMKVIQTEAETEDVTAISEATDNIDTCEEYLDTASQSAELEKALKDNSKEENSWAEKVTGKQLNTLKCQLEKLQELYNTGWRSYTLSEAINYVEKADIHKKRNNTMLNNLFLQQPLTVYASTFVFPEMFEHYLEFWLEEQQKRTASLVDEIVETYSEQQSILNTYALEIAKLRDSNEYYKTLVEKAQQKLDSMKKNNSVANLTSLGYYVKNTNIELLNHIDQQIEDLRYITEELDMAVEYCEQYCDFIRDEKISIATKSKYFAEIRGSIKDILNKFKSYKYKQEFRLHKMENLYNHRYEKFIERVGKEEIRSSRVGKQLRSITFSSVKEPLDRFDAHKDLECVFQHFGFKEADTDLFECLKPYVSGESWHPRYKEPKE